MKSEIIVLQKENFPKAVFEVLVKDEPATDTIQFTMTAV